MSLACLPTTPPRLSCPRRPSAQNLQRGAKKDRHCHECHALLRFFFDDVALEFFGYAGGSFALPALPGGSDDEGDGEDGAGAGAGADRGDRSAQRKLLREAQSRAQRGEVRCRKKDARAEKTPSLREANGEGRAKRAWV